MLITVLPYDFGSVFANAQEDISHQDNLNDYEASALSEIVNERDAYTKRFAMSDGTIAAMQYDRPVHYQDETGAWVDYDNSLNNANNIDDGGNSDDLVNGGYTSKVF